MPEFGTHEALLTPPTGTVDVVIDTDAFNEIDDQFAIVHALLTPKLNVEAICAAPFHNRRRATTGPADGMEQSFREIERVLDHLAVSTGASYGGAVLRGATDFLSDRSRPVESDAVTDLIDRALADRDGPLYVLALGASTNVVSALLAEPRIADRIVVVVLGGWPHHAPDFPFEFNFSQDRLAAQLLFASAVPLVHLPGLTVSEALRTTRHELAEHLSGRGAIGDYLFELFDGWVPRQPGASKPLWDLAPGAWLIEPDWVQTRLQPAPDLRDDLTYAPREDSHPMRLAIRVDRDRILGDLFTRLADAT